MQPCYKTANGSLVIKKHITAISKQIPHDPNDGVQVFIHVGKQSYLLYIGDKHEEVYGYVIEDLRLDVTEF